MMLWSFGEICIRYFHTFRNSELVEPWRENWVETSPSPRRWVGTPACLYPSALSILTPPSPRLSMADPRPLGHWEGGCGGCGGDWEGLRDCGEFCGRQRNLNCLGEERIWEKFGKSEAFEGVGGFVRGIGGVERFVAIWENGRCYIYARMNKNLRGWKK